MTDHEAQAAWRLFTLNWIPLGVMALTLGALPRVHPVFHEAGGRVALARGHRALCRHRLLQRADAAQARPAGNLRARLDRAIDAGELPDDAAHVCGGRARPAAAGRQLGRARPRARARMGVVFLVLLPPAGADTGASPRLCHDRLAGVWHSGGAGLDRPLPPPAAIYACLRDRADRDHGAFRLLPAIGTYAYFHLWPDPSVFSTGSYATSADSIPLLRGGTMRVLDITQLVGIVTFPSFHTCAAVLYLWAFWPVRWMRPLSLASNGMLLIATPIGGGHYFIDIIAGAAIAVLAIAAAKWLAARLTRDAGAAAMALSGAAVPAE